MWIKSVEAKNIYGNLRKIYEDWPAIARTFLLLPKVPVFSAPHHRKESEAPQLKGKHFPRLLPPTPFHLVSRGLGAGGLRILTSSSSFTPYFTVFYSVTKERRVSDKEGERLIWISCLWLPLSKVYRLNN